MSDEWGVEESPVVVAPEVQDIKLFGKWSTDDVQVSDISLTVSVTFLFGSLGTRVFETRMVTGSELISLLTYPLTTTLLSIFSPLKISSRKIWETLWSKHAKCSLPVAVHVLKGGCLSSLLLLLELHD